MNSWISVKDRPSRKEAPAEMSGGIVLLDPGQVSVCLQLPQRGAHCVPARAADGG